MVSAQPKRLTNMCLLNLGIPFQIMGLAGISSYALAVLNRTGSINFFLPVLKLFLGV
jgi:hypothetical protein